MLLFAPDLRSTSGTTMHERYTDQGRVASPEKCLTYGTVDVNRLNMTRDRINDAALYAALDAKRIELSLSWRQVAKQVEVSPSTFTRLAQGRLPDVNSFAAIIQWLAIPAESFFTKNESTAPQKDSTMAIIASHLRADKNLSHQGAEALKDILQAAYRRIKEIEQ